MIKKTLFLILSLIIVSQIVNGQVVVSLKMDSNQIYIGEQVQLKLRVIADINQTIVLPTFPDSQLVEGVEVLDSYRLSNELLDAGRRQALTQCYLITSFDSALYYIPPLEVEVDGQKYQSQTPMALKVISPEVDTLGLKPFGPKGNAEIYYDWNDLSFPLLLWAIGLLMLLLSFYIAVQIKNNHRLLPKIRLRPLQPPHKWALKQVAKLSAHKPTTPEQAHQYYSMLSDIVRIYIEKRYNFKATAMTTAQLIDRLSLHNDPLLLEKLNKLFLAADMIKYAAIRSDISEDDSNLLIASEYINATHLETEQKKKPQTKQQKEVVRSHRVRALLVSFDTALAAIGFGLIVWAAALLYNMIF